MKHAEETMIEKIIAEIENAGNEYGNIGLNETYKKLIIGTIFAAKEAVEKKEKEERKLYYSQMTAEDALKVIETITRHIRPERQAKRLIKMFVTEKRSAKDINDFVKRSLWFEHLINKENDIETE